MHKYLNLDPIPQDLTELSTIERRLISYRLPFLTLIAIRRYGGHCKINGPPFNVPAKVDKIVEMLPRMPNELQLIPLKLKRKIEYKSYYMYDVVQKDCIIGTLTWLKTHNNFYKDIPIKYNWYSTVPNDSQYQIIKNWNKMSYLQNIISVTHVKIKLFMVLYNIHHMTTVQMLINTVI